MKYFGIQYRDKRKEFISGESFIDALLNKSGENSLYRLAIDIDFWREVSEIPISHKSIDISDVIELDLDLNHRGYYLPFIMEVDNFVDILRSLIEEYHDKKEDVIKYPVIDLSNDKEVGLMNLKFEVHPERVDLSVLDIDTLTDDHEKMNLVISIMESKDQKSSSKLKKHYLGVPSVKSS